MFFVRVFTLRTLVGQAGVKLIEFIQAVIVQSRAPGVAALAFLTLR